MRSDLLAGGPDLPTLVNGHLDCGGGEDPDDLLTEVVAVGEAAAESADSARTPFDLRWVHVAVGGSLRDAEVIEAGAASGYTRRRRRQAPAASPGRTPPALPGCRSRVHRAAPRAGPRGCRTQGRHTP
jgi:hypothetical protein